MIYQALTRLGVPLWRACAHDSMVEHDRVVTSSSMSQAFWCPDCGAHRTVTTRRG